MHTGDPALDCRTNVVEPVAHITRRIVRHQINPIINTKSFKFKESAVIVDVGINRDDDGLHGDVEPGLPVRLQTPVPGGVGLLTRLALIENLLKIGK